MDHHLSDPQDKAGLMLLRPLQVPPSGTHQITVFQTSPSVEPTNRRSLLALQTEIEYGPAQAIETIHR
jgi:hypothetical protein